VTKAADIIAVLAAGKPGLVFERRSGMTHGWGLWMRSLPERLGTIRSDLAEAMVGLLAQRPRRPPPPRVAAMGRWQTFRSLFYPHWDPPLREERGLRWLSGGISVLMHLLFVLLLVLVAMVRVPPSPPNASDGTRVQVEFIGQRTSEQEEGGGPPAAGAAPASVAAQAPSPAPRPAAASAAAQASTFPQQEQPSPAPPVAQQPLQVTEIDTPTSRFVLPPPNPTVPEFVAPVIAAPELSVPTREVTVVEVPPAQRAPPQDQIAVPNQAEAVVEIREREMPTPVPRVPTVRVPAREIAAPDVRAPAPSVRQRDVPSPSSAASGAARSDANLSANTPGSTGAQSATQQAQGTRPAATASGAANSYRNGALPSPRRGDAARNTPGQAGPGQAGTTPGLAGGLFNADGSVRLPSDGAAGTAPTAGPPGSRQAQQADADRASKWLERPQYPYEPTMFDKYWVPNESLLAEWVRRAIREVEVPIPGTSKRVRCVVSVLQAGGACGLFDPNLNEQPATARPPPDIPAKRNPIPTDS